jgi:hypothetical protein
MPPVSQKQRRAMGAAKAGKSTLGIPQDVGADFIAADPGGKLPPSAPKPPKPQGLGSMIAKQRKGRGAP